MKPDVFRQELAKIGIDLSDEQMTQFKIYYELLVEWNQKINLTAITELEEVYLKHFYDSITLATTLDLGKESYSLCDVGAGAGFPSIPIKIVYPNLKISIVDSLNKRIKFLTLLCDELKLENVNLYHDRAETFGQDKAHRESYDFVTARAVARLNVLSELCIPLVKKNGQFLALKAAKSEEEVQESKKAIATLGGKLADEIEISLPFSEDKRYIVVIDKKKETPNKYPRKPGTPNKKPLI
ncbi:16S rRNA (guanine(527)-N(7))-methyltransferase RsmG [Vagococcus carniphilus]|uniref:Ribosomal RNA small subunit methyltransferase G n=1 Tax=Vagococcus carniphilus TaxID=218144 RepID=A0AAW8U194_9ENTE|nr:16S rRNA (guanine(527)-N(7))-methyltransferase RsmG [Vagococcus carniphilus]MDT2815917.1 16S rRNA (guanine(527)-N(7))-methyltransferase RsmG [Vagococcus carniphilus]MDT2831383.1 16S rRNA (guanine(527)-N(7))-methyltransferase RsmG [Vagococcus carniphilus]MDT2832844.1 16S rRNA (guanine(527)-N(7))-methyltransferase RsmG [Vagococcus carniphilus]MDT2840283.1 16S rRNA (guanine(527)-N(7))-methyltransferase RsmG [Vagococcus carniphilus]MDT2854788.1 16S rRNA (guanine(527)-N(7))-methyltransferase Rsm